MIEYNWSTNITKRERNKVLNSIKEKRHYKGKCRRSNQTNQTTPATIGIKISEEFVIIGRCSSQVLAAAHLLDDLTDKGPDCVYFAKQLSLPYPHRLIRTILLWLNSFLCFVCSSPYLQTQPHPHRMTKITSSTMHRRKAALSRRKIAHSY